MPVDSEGSHKISPSGQNVAWSRLRPRARTSLEHWNLHHPPLPCRVEFLYPS